MSNQEFSDGSKLEWVDEDHVILWKPYTLSVVGQVPCFARPVGSQRSEALQALNEEFGDRDWGATPKWGKSGPEGPFEDALLICLDPRVQSKGDQSPSTEVEVNEDQDRHS